MDSAVSALNQAESNLETAQSVLDAAERALAVSKAARDDAYEKAHEAHTNLRQVNADPGATRSQRKAAQEAVDSAEADVEQAEKDYKEIEKNKEEAQREVDAREREVENKTREKERVENTSPVDETFGTIADTAACRRMVFGGIDPEDPVSSRRLAEGWSSAWGGFPGRINPNPESATVIPGSPASALGRAICGLDEATTQRHHASCQMLVHCPTNYLGTEDCGCRGRDSSAGLALAASCHQIINCPADMRAVGMGQLCACESNQDRDVGRPERPGGPDPAELGALFDAPDRSGLTTDESRDPIGASIESIMKLR